MNHREYTKEISKGKTYYSKKQIGKIKCISGRLWITMPNSDDIIMEETASFNADSRSICIYALEDSLFAVKEKPSILSRIWKIIHAEKCVKKETVIT